MNLEPLQQDAQLRVVCAADWIRRQWLRFTLCEPEEWAEIKYSRPTASWVKRKARYEFTYGEWKEDRS